MRKKNLIDTIIYNHKEKKQLGKFSNQWLQIMVDTNTMNKYFETITLKNIQIEEYGYSAELLFPVGLRTFNLTKLQSSIEDNLYCKFLHNNELGKPYATCKFIFNKTI